MLAWEELGRNRHKLDYRFREIAVAESQGKRLPKEKHFTDRGIGKAKVLKPSPGWRAFYFRDGDTRYVTRIALKGDDHDQQIQAALEARAEHESRRRSRSQK